MQQGPFDLSNVKCYAPEGCCPPDPCAITKEDLICAIRTLLPEGPVFNPAIAGDPLTPSPSPPGVGCFPVGCSVVCDGAEVPNEPCTDTPQQMQINTVDVFAATTYTALQAYCCMLRELDPCTAVNTVDRWLERYGVLRSPCDAEWSADLKSMILCLISKLSNNFVLNKRNLESLAAYFGVTVKIYNAGDFNCDGIPGMWTLDRGRTRGGTPTGCAPVDICGTEDRHRYLLGKESDGYHYILTGLTESGRVNLEGLYEGVPSVPITPPPVTVAAFGSCVTLPGIDIVVCQAETIVPDNCLLPGTGRTVQPTAELYDAFFWLIEYILPVNVDLCFYRCEDTPCGENV